MLCSGGSWGRGGWNRRRRSRTGVGCFSAENPKRPMLRSVNDQMTPVRNLGHGNPAKKGTKPQQTQRVYLVTEGLSGQTTLHQQLGNLFCSETFVGIFEPKLLGDLRRLVHCSRSHKVIRTMTNWSKAPVRVSEKKHKESTFFVKVNFHFWVSWVLLDLFALRIMQEEGIVYHKFITDNILRGSSMGGQNNCLNVTAMKEISGRKRFLFQRGWIHRRWSSRRIAGRWCPVPCIRRRQ